MLNNSTFVFKEGLLLLDGIVELFTVLLLLDFSGCWVAL